jgi:hypothetical protein
MKAYMVYIYAFYILNPSLELLFQAVFDRTVLFQFAAFFWDLFRKVP